MERPFVLEFRRDQSLLCLTMHERFAENPAGLC
jgi:hypothetical protein